MRAHLDALRAVGVNHVALNLRFNRAPIEATLEKLAEGLSLKPPGAPEHAAE